MASLYCAPCGPKRLPLAYRPGEATTLSRGSISPSVTIASLLCDSCNRPILSGDHAYLIEYFTTEAPLVSDLWEDYFDFRQPLSGARTSPSGPRKIVEAEYTVFSCKEFREFFGSGDTVIESIRDDFYLIATRTAFMICDLSEWDPLEMSPSDTVLMIAGDPSLEDFLYAVSEAHDDIRCLRADVEAAAERVGLSISA